MTALEILAELLAKLDAAGVQPLTEEQLIDRARVCLRQLHFHPEDARRAGMRALVNLLEARAKLEAVRDSMESDLRLARPTSAAEVLGIIGVKP